MAYPTIINNELSREEFIDAINTRSIPFVAPLKYMTSHDSCGCQPAVYDTVETLKTNNYFIDSIVKNMERYSENKNLSLVMLAKQDAYARQPTLAEAKMDFLRLAGTVSAKELDFYKWKKGSDVDGILIEDANGKIFDYPLNYRWIKSVFSTAIIPAQSLDNLSPFMGSLFNNVDSLSEIVCANNSKDTFRLIRGDYTLIAIAPNAIGSCSIESSTFDSYIRNFSIEKHLKIIDKSKIPKIGASEGYYEFIFESERQGYDAQTKKGDKLSLPSCFDINNRIN